MGWQGVMVLAGPVGSDDNALALAASRDGQAFVALYERCLPSVYRYLRARCRSEDEAAELTAVTFERAYRAIRTYRANPGGPLPWLIRIARNAAVDADRRRWLTIDHRLPGLRPLLLETPTPEDAALAGEQRATLYALLRRLPEPQGDAIVLRYGNGMTAAQIGIVIGRSEAAAQKLISRGLATLREIYHD